MYVSIPSWAFVPVASVEQQLMNTTYLEIAFWEAEVAALQQHYTLQQQQNNNETTFICVKFFVGCIAAKFAERQKHSIPLEPISCLSMQTKNQGMKSPVSCAGLDRFTIKGSKSREPIPFAANRMSKCFSLRSPLPSSCQDGKVVLCQLWRSQSQVFALWMSGLMKREHENYDKDEFKKEKV